MKKFLAIIFTIFLAYLAALYTSKPRNNSIKEEVPENTNSISFIEEFSRAIMSLFTIDTTDISQLSERAFERYYDYQYNKAMKDFRRIIRIDSTHGEAYYYIGIIQQELGDTAQAIKTYLKLSNIDPFYSEVFCTLGNYYLENNKLDSAYLFLQKCLLRAGGKYSTKINLVKFFLLKENFDSALHYAELQTTDYPSYAEGFEIKRQVYTRLKNYDEAKKCYQKVLELSPYFYPDLLEAGRNAVNDKKYIDAINYFTQLIDIKGKTAEALEERAWVYYLIEDYQKAIRDYNEAIILRPEYFNYINRGLVHYYNNDYKNALNDYNKAIELSPNYYLTYNNRGLLYYKTGNYQKALKDYDQCIALKNDYTTCFYNRGILLVNMEKYSRALIDFLFLEKTTSNNNVYYFLGVCFEKTENTQGAVDNYNRFLENTTKENKYYQKAKEAVERLK